MSRKTATNPSRRRFLSAALAAGGAAAIARPMVVLAQSTKPITLIVGFPPGGAPDLIARVVAESLKERTGRVVVVENRPGANGQMAMQATKNAGTGSTTTVIVSPIEAVTLQPHVKKSLPYDPAGDFTPLASLSSNAYGLAVGPLANVGSIKEFVAWCKAHEKDATFGTPGLGTPHHLLGEEFARLAGIKLTHVSYRGGNDVLQDVQGGSVASLVAALPLLVTRRQPGKLTVIGSTGTQRHPLMPEVPTFAEAGFPQMTSDGVMGMFTSVKTSKEDAKQIAVAMNEVVKTDTFAQSVSRFGQEPHPLDEKTLDALLKTESARWKKVVADINFAPD